MEPEHDRILGLETEVILREGGGGEPAPAGKHALEQRLFETLLRGRVYGLSASPKGGVFLENGGLTHLERHANSVRAEPVLELCTPECRSPWDLLVYSRAMDRLLEEAHESPPGDEAERAHAPGPQFVKSNRDSRGVGIGCHENYTVRDRPAPVDRLKRLLARPLLRICSLLCDALAILELACHLAAAGARRLWARAMGKGSEDTPSPWPTGSVGAPRPPHSRALRQAWVALSTFRMIVYYPLIWTIEIIVRLTALRTARRALSPLLATRAILTGSGSLSFRAGVYELSQRAPFIRAEAKVRIFGAGRMLFDLKRHVLKPFHLYEPLQRLVIVSGDANLSDIPALLKVGTVCLILEMVEAGEEFPEVELAHPARALRETSLGGPWKQLPLRAGGLITALDVQKAYLARAMAFYKDRPEGRLRPRALLSLWAECLDLIERHDPACAETFDWAAKRALLDAAILAQTSWKTFFAWGKLLHLAGDRAARGARDLESLVRRTPWPQRWRLRKAVRKANLVSSELPAQRALYDQARKIDLRYHELGAEPGYQRSLEAEGLVRRLVTDESVVRATRMPPEDTRARVRSYYIRRSPDPRYVYVDWDELWTRQPALHVALQDPFYARVPTDPPGRPEP